MSPTERNELRDLKLWLYGEDGTGGSIGELRADVKSLRSDMDFIKGAVKLAVVALTFFGFSGALWFITNAATVANAHP